MYYVYKISFPELNAVYIGCTNNLRRRKDQHNGNARRGKSYLGRFLADNGISLSEDDLQVIGEYDVRQDALDYERSTALSYKDTDVHLLNDVYSNHSTRKGLKGIKNPSTKEYVVIDIEEHVGHFVRDMHAWCDKHPGVSYKTLIGTAKQKPLMHCGRYIARHFDEWDSMPVSECIELLSGEWYRKRREESESKRVRKTSRTYLLETPNGYMFVRNLDKFARENGINPGNLHASLSTGRYAQGYKVVEKLA